MFKCAAVRSAKSRQLDLTGRGHGAGPTAAMVHLALHEALDGAPVAWLEQVSDKQYGAPGLSK
jgi:hypothetical protein